MLVHIAICLSAHWLLDFIYLMKNFQILFDYFWCWFWWSVESLSSRTGGSCELLPMASWYSEWDFGFDTQCYSYANIDFCSISLNIRLCFSTMPFDFADSIDVLFIVIPNCAVLKIHSQILLHYLLHCGLHKLISIIRVHS